MNYVPPPTLDVLAKSARRRRRQRRPVPLPDAGPAAPAQAADQNVTRVLGPYRNGKKWRLVLLDGSARKALVAHTYETALAMRDKLRAEITAHVSCTIGEALDEYIAALQASGVLTHDRIQRMLRQFLPLDKPLSAISAGRAEQLYLAEAGRTKKNGKPIAADTHHLLLRRLKRFYKWAVGRRYVDDNPFAEVRPIGRCRRGKPQLRIDEARRFVACALEHAQKLDVGATAALLQIFLGLRPTEAIPCWAPLASRCTPATPWPSG